MVALVGWTVVLLIAVRSLLFLPADQRLSNDSTFFTFLLFCELICASEVVRIGLGMMRGDILLGFTVHYTRLLMIFVVMPDPSVTCLNQKVIILAWAATEVARYPMVIFRDIKPLRTLRYAVPLITFPQGAGSEAWAAFSLLQVTNNQMLFGALCLVVLINVGGGLVWYPSMVRKVHKSLYVQQTQKKNDTVKKKK